MKRFVVLLSFSALLLGGAALWTQVVRADPAAPMTDAHIARIRSNCVDAQSSLAQLHASDALLRVNRGQLYESISTKLMAPLNSRIALNKLDGAALESTTVTYEHTLDQFRSDYQQYEQALSRVLALKCTDQPVSFYDGVSVARDDRQKVHADVLSLQTLIKQYQTDFETFATTALKGAS